MTAERLERYRSQQSHNYFPQLRLWVLSHYFIHFVMYSSPSQFLSFAAFSKVVIGILSKNYSQPLFQLIISIPTLLLINKCINICIYLREDGTRTAAGIDKYSWADPYLQCLGKTSIQNSHIRMDIGTFAQVHMYLGFCSH